MTTEPFDWPRQWDPLRRRDPGVVTVFGKMVIDDIHNLDAPLVKGGQVTATKELRAGGAPANITSELARHKVSARFAGWIGTDPSAKKLASVLKSRGIELQVKFEGESPSATVMIEPGGDRTFLTNDGTGSLEPNELKNAWFSNASVVHLDGYDLLRERFPNAVIHASRKAMGEGALVSMDMGAANRIVDHGADAYADLIAEIRPHVIFANRDEEEALGLLERNFSWKPIIAVHRGTEPTIVKRGNQQFEVPVSMIEIVDSTGCGDAFAAGFLAGWVENASLQKSVERAHAWAAEVGKVIGGHVESDMVPMGRRLG